MSLPNAGREGLRPLDGARRAGLAISARQAANECRAARGAALPAPPPLPPPLGLAPPRWAHKQRGANIGGGVAARALFDECFDAAAQLIRLVKDPAEQHDVEKTRS